MEILTKKLDDFVEIVCKGSITTHEQTLEFKKTLHKNFNVYSSSKIKIIFEDCYSLPSSVIGAILELKEIEKADIEVVVDKDELYSALKKLTLIEILNVSKNT
ncbi:MAG: hypothetical protein ACLFQJ_02025 [Campylobacterales bacterium]